MAKTKLPAVGAGKKEGRLSRTLRECKTHRTLLLMMIPGMLYYLLFHYKPMYGILIAFKDYRMLDGIMASPWAGTKYFRMAFENPEFWRVFKNTLILSGYKLVFTFPAPIILALLINEVRCLRFKKFVQTMTYMPHFLSWVILAGVLTNFLSPSIGPINMLLKVIGLDTIYFMGESKYFRAVLVASSIWKEAGWGTIIYLAALTNVDSQLYEAAMIDGAGIIRRTTKITLPNMYPMILLFAINQVKNIFNIMVEPLTMTGGGPNNASLSLGLQSYKYAFQYFRMADSVALSTVIWVIIMMFTVIYVGLDRKLEQ